MNPLKMDPIPVDWIRNDCWLDKWLEKGSNEWRHGSNEWIHGSNEWRHGSNDFVMNPMIVKWIQIM